MSRSSEPYRPQHADVWALCSALNDGHCSCRLNGNACRVWWELLRQAGGRVDALIVAERQRIESNRARNYPGIGNWMVQT